MARNRLIEQIQELDEKCRVNYSNPAQLRERVEFLEWENEMLKRSESRLIDRVHEKNHNKKEQLLSRKRMHLEAFVCGILGAGFLWMFVLAVNEVASWL